MLKTYNYYDITDLLVNPKRDNFIFEEKKYNTFFGQLDKTLMIKGFSTGENAQKLTTFIYSLNKRLGIENQSQQPQEPKQPTRDIKYDPTPYLDKIEDIKELSNEFLETMQLANIFKEDYQEHKNIKLYNGIHEILYFTNGTRHNARFKWNGKYKYSNWSTFKKESGFESIGGFFEGANDKRSTLLLLEGLKDGVNGNIGTPQCDVLATDSKSTPFLFELIKDISKYKTIILFQDRELIEKPKEIINLFKKLKAEERKILNKIYYVDYNKMPNGAKDLTDFLESLKMKDKSLKRNALGKIKKVLHGERVKDLENSIEVADKIDVRIQDAVKFNNLPLFKEQVQKKLKLKGDITEEIKYYIKKQVTPPTNHTLINLSASKFLSEVTSQIVEQFDQHSKIILGSPTGTGKSTFTKENLTKHYKNMIIIAPLKKVAGELADTNVVQITHIENNEKLDFVMANINAPYLSVTTDTIYNLLHNKITEDELKERLSKCELVVFDEQHIVHQSQNFRGKVVWINDFLRDHYNGKVLSMSGTPIYSDLPNFHPILCRLDKRYFSTIEYYLDPFKDEAHLLQSIKENLKRGNVLLYSKSRKKAHLMQKYLIQNSINTLLVTSRGNTKVLEDKEEIEVDDSGINDIKENMAIVSTTRATTGANFDRLSVIYQFGSAYDPHTFIQLMARIRGNGKYYFIKTAGDKAQDESIMNKAINILNIAKKLNLKKASDLFTSNSKYIKDNIELPYEEYNLKAFLLTYKRSLQMIHSEQLGKMTEDNEDFEFKNRLDEIEENSFNNIFKNGDSAEFTKYIEREMIDFLQRKGDVEILNHAYNLSFDIVHKNKELKYEDVDSKVFVTLEDLAETELKKEEKKEKVDRFKSEIVKKFDWLLTKQNQSDFFKEFSGGELAKLIQDDRLDLEKVQTIILHKSQKTKEKFTRLRFFLMAKKTIIAKIINVIKVKEFVTIKELSTILEQEVYLTMKTIKNPFVPFLKDFIEDEGIVKDGLELLPYKRINGKKENNIITLPKEKLKELKEITSKEEQEYERQNHLDRILEAKIKAYGEDIEVVITREKEK
jgi:hypothetical protein